jgi:hypothetical protein
MRILGFIAATLVSSSAFALNCGDTITTHVKLKNDLDCSSFSGFAAVILRGDGKLDGMGRKIISPNTSVGVYAEGNQIRVSDLKIEGAPEATGVLGYNVVRLVVDRVEARQMNIGVDYYTEVDYDCDRLRVSNSDLSGNNYAAKVIAPKCEYVPRFINNDLSNSAVTALNLSAKRLRIRDIQGNIFNGSVNGLSLKSSEQTLVEGLDLSSSQISGTQIYAYSSNELVIRNVITGEAQEGIHVYDVKNVSIKNTEAVNNEIGIKVANDSVSTDLRIAQSKTEGNVQFGVLVTSFGSVKFSQISLPKNNEFADTVAVFGQQ